MIDLNYEFDAELWPYYFDTAVDGPAPATPWVFLTMPVEASEEIRFFKTTRTGFGSVKLTITIGATTWKTSGFPSKQHKAFIIPVKKDVRKAEGLVLGDTVAVKIHVALEPF